MISGKGVVEFETTALPESVSFPLIQIRINNWLDPESGSVSFVTDPNPTKTNKNGKKYFF